MANYITKSNFFLSKIPHPLQERQYQIESLYVDQGSFIQAAKSTDDVRELMKSTPSNCQSWIFA
jgi:hypothetical protein